MNRLDENDDLLDRAARAMAEAPGEGEFPEQEILRHVQSVLSSNGHGPKAAGSVGVAARRRPVASLGRLFMRPAVSVAASLLIAAGALVGLTWALLHTNAAMAFSTVARHLHEARTMTADITVRESSVALSGRFYFAAPGHIRVEFPGIPTEVADLETGRVVVIDNAAKTAIVMKLDKKDVSPADDPTARALDWIEKLRDISHSVGRQVGRDEVNGVSARQFLVNEDGQDISIWADAKTGAPLRVESAAKLGQRVVNVMLDHLALDQPIEDEQFSTAVPAGYTQQQATVSAAEAGEKDLVAFLKDYASRTWAFPPSVGDLETMVQPMVSNAGVGTLPPAELMQSMLQASRAVLFIGRLPDSADWHYAGPKVKPNASDAASSPLFWYHPNSSKSWRVIYADLHTADVTSSAITADATERQHKG